MFGVGHRCQFEVLPTCSFAGLYSCDVRRAEFEKDHNNGKELRSASTPALVRDEPNRNVPSYVPDLKATCQKHGGGLLWLCRGTRPDLCAIVTRITRRYQQWDRDCDHALFRVFQYLKGTQGLGIVLYGHPDDLKDVKLAIECDADHGQDPGETKSTSGMVMYLYGKRTFTLLDWYAKKQTVATARSTGEAEVVACDSAIFNIAMPWTLLLEGILKRLSEWI